MSETDPRCEICGSAQLEPVARVAGVPVFCNRLLDSRSEALEAATADIELAFCGSCGHLFNVAFDPGKLRYAAGYENALHFSPRFREYAAELARNLARRYVLDGGTVVEIGCGDGDFLRTLCDGAGCRGVGFDPSYTDHGDAASHDVDVTVRSEAFTTESSPADADLVCCRHCLEHVPDPVAFLSDVRRALRPRTPVYFEVPNGLHMLRRGGVWDLIYEHCSYFTPTSVVRAFEEAGLRVLDLEETFGEQFLSVHARTTSPSERPRRDANVPREVRDAVRRFGDAARRKRAGWTLGLEHYERTGRRAVVWGAGSKGVTFLSAVARDAITHAVDVNPRKAGRFVPRGGQEVVPPERLSELAPDTLIVMNPIYSGEIGAAVRDLGLDVEILEA